MHTKRRAIGGGTEGGIAKGTAFATIGHVLRKKKILPCIIIYYCIGHLLVDPSEKNDKTMNARH